MTVLTRGANAPIATGKVEVSVPGARQGSVDLMVFALGPDHKVSSDSAFVSFNPPAAPEGSALCAGTSPVTPHLRNPLGPVRLRDARRTSPRSSKPMGVPRSVSARRVYAS